MPDYMRTLALGTRPRLDPDDLEVHLPAFHRHLRADGKSEGTVEKYDRAVRSFLAFLVEEDRPTTAGKIRKADVEAYLVAGRAQAKPATLNTRFISLGVFFKWLLAEGIIERYPLQGMKVSAGKPPLVPVLSTAERKALLKACQGREFEDLRDTAIIRVFMATGMRLAEVANLEVKDLEATSHWYLVGYQAKGGVDAASRLTDKAAVALDRYLRARERHARRDEPWLWLGQKGHLTRSGIRQMLERRAAQAKISHVHPHQFRHTFAHLWQASGGSENDLMYTLNWKSRAMLGRYAASAARERALAAHARMAPGDDV